MNTENPFIKHLIEFGKEIKKNGELVKSEENKSMYKWRTERYEYAFKMSERHGVPIYDLSVILIFQNSQKCIPVLSIQFTDYAILGVLNNKDFVEINKKIGKINE